MVRFHVHALYTIRLTDRSSGCTSPPRSYPPHTKKPHVPLVPPVSAQEEEEMELTAHLVEIGTTTARRRVVPLASSGRNSLVLDGVHQESRSMDCVGCMTLLTSKLVVWAVLIC